MSDKPELLIWYWPTRFGRHDLERWDGSYNQASEVQVWHHSTTYNLKFPGMGVWVDSGIQGNTQSLRVEHEPIRCPKTRKGIETRWRYGRWEKYLKTRGWVAA